MIDFEELEFVIPAFTPETMPLPRLLEYLREIATVVGVAEDMHLIRIEENCTKPVFKLPRPTAALARRQADAVRQGRGTAAQRGAFDKIRQMVRHDGGEPANLKDRSGVILSFLPLESSDAIVATVRQPTSFDGELMRIGGAGEYSAVQMRDVAGKIYSGFTASRSTAKAMCGMLFEPLRVTGTGTWERTRNGHWNLSRMLISSFERIEDETAEEVMRRLGAVKVAWPQDADALLAAERGATE
jgi:hypothetical protein